MYSTCLFCSARLGANESVEHFPVGRRLAFDAARGRLWVICRRCARWNLTPLEERWEAIEECERLFRASSLRTSTDNIGLARVREGLELVRIGAPERTEFAAWRYGRHFVRRLNRGVVVGSGVVAVGAALSVAAGGFAFSSLLLPAVLASNYPLIRRLAGPRVKATVPLANGRSLRINGWFAGSARLRRRSGTGEMELLLLGEDGEASVTGDAVLPALARLSAATNVNGALPAQVRRAVAALEQEGGPHHFIDALSRRPHWKPADWSDRLQMSLKPGHARRWVANPPSIAMLPVVDRVALEMAANEERERAALEGELAALEAEWAAAERIAAIADDLLLPHGVEQRLGRLRGDAR